MASLKISIDARLAKQGSQEVNAALQSMATQATKSVTEIDKLREGFVRQERIIKTLQADLRNFGAAAAAASTQAQTGFSGMFTAISRVHGVLLSLGAAISVGGLARLTKDALDTAGTLVDTADRIGITVEALQELQFAATQSGVSTETFSQSMEFFSVKLAEAARGTTDVSKILKQFGLDAKNLSKDPAAAIAVVAEKIAGMTNQAEKLRVTRELFSRGGTEMLNMLQIGGPALDALRQKIRDLGGVMEEDLARKAEAMGDEFETATQVIGVQFKQALIELAPYIVRTAQLLGEAAVGMRNWIQETRTASQKSAAQEMLKLIAEEIDKVEQKLKTLDQQTSIGNAIDTVLGVDAGKLQKRLAELHDMQRQYSSVMMGWNEVVGGASTTVGKLTGEIEGLTEAQTKARDEITKNNARIKEHAETLNLSGEALARYHQAATLKATNDQAMADETYRVVLALEKEKAAKEATTKATQDAAEAERKATKAKEDFAQAVIDANNLVNKMNQELAAVRKKEDDATTESLAKLQEELVAMQEEGRLIQASIGPKTTLRDLELSIARARIEREAATKLVADGERTLTEEEKKTIEATKLQALANVEAAASFTAMKDSIEDAALTTADLKSVTQGILSGTQSIGDIFEDLGQTAGVRMVEGIMFGKGQNEKAILGNFNQLLGVDAAGIFGAQGMNLGTTLTNSIQSSLSSAGVNLGSLFGTSFSSSAGSVISGGSSTAGGMFGNVVAGGSSTAAASGGALGTIFGGAMAGAAGIALGKGLTSMFGGGSKQASIGGTVGGGVGAIAGGVLGSVFPVIGTMLGSALGGLFGSIGGSLIGGLFASTPSKGTEIRKGAKKFLKEIEASFASEIDSGDYFFEETKKLAKKMFGGDGGQDFLKASKVILNDKIGPELAKQLQALGTFITEKQARKTGKDVEQTGTTFGNMLLDNLGLDPKEIQGAIDEIIQKAGISFDTLTEKLTTLFEKGEIGAKFYTDAVQGAVDIFYQDLPEAIGAAKLAMQSFGEDGIFNLEKFQAALEESTAMFDVVVNSFLDVVQNSKPGEDIGKLLGEQINKGLEEIVVNQFLKEFVETRLFEGVDLTNGLDADELALIQSRAGEARLEVDKLRSSFSDVGEEVDDATEKVEELFDTIRSLTNQRFSLRLDVISDLESIGAISGLDAARARVGAYGGQVSRFANPTGLGATDLSGMSDLELEQGVESLRNARQAQVDLFQAQEQAAQEALGNRIRDINADYNARRAALANEAQAAQAASESRLSALAQERDDTQRLFQERIDGLQEELQIAQEFRQVAESIQDTINGLVQSSSRFSGPEQIAIFEQQADALRRRLQGTTGSERAAIIEQLSSVLQQQLAAGEEVMSQSAFSDMFDSVVKELESLRDEAAVEGDRVEQIQNAIAQTTAQMQISLESIDAQMEAERAAAAAAQQAFAAQAEALSQQEQAAVAAAQAATDAEIAALRMEAVAEIQRLAVIEDQILAEQLKRAEYEVSLTEEQVTILHSINSGIDNLTASIVGFLDSAISAQTGYEGWVRKPQLFITHPNEHVRISPSGPAANNQVTFAPSISVSMNGGGNTEVDAQKLARGLSQAMLNEWRNGQMGREIRQTVERKS